MISVTGNVTTLTVNGGGGGSVTGNVNLSSGEQLVVGQNLGTLTVGSNLVTSTGGKLQVNGNLGSLSVGGSIAESTGGSIADFHRPDRYAGGGRSGFLEWRDSERRPRSERNGLDCRQSGADQQRSIYRRSQLGRDRERCNRHRQRKPECGVWQRALCGRKLECAYGRWKCRSVRERSGLGRRCSHHVDGQWRRWDLCYWKRDLGHREG